MSTAPAPSQRLPIVPPAAPRRPWMALTALAPTAGVNECPHSARSCRGHTARGASPPARAVHRCGAAAGATSVVGAACLPAPSAGIATRAPWSSSATHRRARRARLRSRRVLGACRPQLVETRWCRPTRRARSSSPTASRSRTRRPPGSRSSPWRVAPWRSPTESRSLSPRTGCERWCSVACSDPRRCWCRRSRRGPGRARERIALGTTAAQAVKEGGATQQQGAHDRRAVAAPRTRRRTKCTVQVKMVPVMAPSLRATASSLSSLPSAGDRLVHRFQISRTAAPPHPPAHPEGGSQSRSH
mmetsp:Transcript_51540/g.103582  ORF Transcript_51540/g.103582 Transcript_51540/m.103582 type:complete len:301 (+) Transcript_51540:167-1069(+)